MKLFAINLFLGALASLAIIQIAPGSQDNNYKVNSQKFQQIEGKKHSIFLET